MIVLIDTTALLSDPHFEGAAWHVLAQAGPRWGLRLFVSEVTLLEAIAGYKRHVADAQASLAQKRLARLGLKELQRTTDDALAQAADGYEQRIRRSLEDLEVALIAPPKVAHVELVERAVNRRRPCDDQGNGYRDTLIWLTFISLAKENPDQQMVFVSDNSRDFGNVGASALHDELMSELQHIGVAERVRWHKNLQQLALALAADNAVPGAADIGAIRESVSRQALMDFIAESVMSSAESTEIDSRACALPVPTERAEIVWIIVDSEERDINLTVQGDIGHGETVVEFSVLAWSAITVVLPQGAMADDPTLVEVISEGGKTIAQCLKELVYSGFITLDRFDRPSRWEMTKVAALPDDPGRRAWAIFDLSRSADVVAVEPDAIRIFEAKYSARTVASIRHLDTPAVRMFVARIIEKLSPEELRRLADRLEARPEESPGYRPTIEGSEIEPNTSDGSS